MTTSRIEWKAYVEEPIGETGLFLGVAMYFEQLDFGSPAFWLLHWAARLRLGQSSYEVELLFVQLDSPETALNDGWPRRLEGRRRSAWVPISCLAYMHLGTVWQCGRKVGAVPLTAYGFNSEEIRHASVELADVQAADGGFLLPKARHPLGGSGLNVALTSVVANGLRLLIHPVAMLQGFFGGSGALYELLFSGAVSHPAEGAVRLPGTCREGEALVLEPHADLTRCDWVRAACWALSDESMRLAANVSTGLWEPPDGVLPGYPAVPIPPEQFTAEVEGIPLSTGSKPTVLVLRVRSVTVELPITRIVVPTDRGPRATKPAGSRGAGSSGRSVIRVLEIAARSERGSKAMEVRAHSAPILSANVPLVLEPRDEIGVAPKPNRQNPKARLDGEVESTRVSGTVQGVAVARDASTVLARIKPPAEKAERSLDELTRVRKALRNLAPDADQIKFRLGGRHDHLTPAGTLFELPERSEHSLPPFAYLRRRPQVKRRFLCAEVVVGGLHWYVLDSEKRGESLALAVVSRDGVRLDDSEIEQLVRRACLLNGVWTRLDGDGLSVRRINHSSPEGLAKALRRAIGLQVALQPAA